MKSLIIARHGKAEKLDFNTLDFERKLVERGKADVQRVSDLLKSRISVQQIVSSPAARAYQTAKIFAKTFNIDKKEIVLKEGIYEASMSGLLKIINDLDNEFEVTLLAGHNPAFEFAIDYFCQTNIGHLPTAGLAIIEFPFDDWRLVSAGTGKLLELIEP